MTRVRMLYLKRSVFISLLLIGSPLKVFAVGAPPWALLRPQPLQPEFWFDRTRDSGRLAIQIAIQAGPFLKPFFQMLRDDPNLLVELAKKNLPDIFSFIARHEPGILSEHLWFQAQGGSQTWILFTPDNSWMSSEAYTLYGVLNCYPGLTGIVKIILDVLATQRASHIN